ncbi:hypothetical protein [Elioraea sp.]|uniref:hypothetical protein n=1 Tax=Elioraea sp. TaxID=2185103 RepID=UPI0025B8347D|nr:hypothetical protein [Elioraea sp.]
MTSADWQRQPARAMPWAAWPGHLRRRFGRMLGIGIAVIAGLVALIVARAAEGRLTPGISLGILLAMLLVAGAIVSRGIALGRRGRVPEASMTLAFLAVPAGVTGLLLAPVALLALGAGISDPAAFRTWITPVVYGRLEHWIVVSAGLALLGVASIVVASRGDKAVATGMWLGAASLVSVIVFGVAGGFLFRPAL